jgi:hypothetical protein
VKSPAATLPSLPRRSRGALARVLAGLWLVLHVFTVAGLPVADGFVDHGDAAVAHFEDADGGTCPADHGTQHCDLCQLLQAGSAFQCSADTLMDAPVTEADRRPAADVVLPRHAATRVGRSPRAPPAIG